MENFNRPNPENRDRQSELLIRFLEKTKKITAFSEKDFKNIFSNEENKRNFIENLTEENFFELLNGLNGILRNKNKEDWKMDGDDVLLGSNTRITNVPPAQEDKKELFKKVFDSTKKMNEKNKSLDDIALLVATSINAIHAYEDANGRTSRFIYEILTNNFDENSKEKIKKILSEKGRKELDLNPGRIISEIETIYNKKINSFDSNLEKITIDNLYSNNNIYFLDFPEQINEKNKNKFLKIFETDERYLKFAIINFLHKKSNLKIENYLKKIGKNTFISLDMFIKDMNNEQIKEIESEYKNIKKEIIEFLIDAIENPDKEDYKIEKEDKQTNIKNILKEKSIGIDK